MYRDRREITVLHAECICADHIELRIMYIMLNLGIHGCTNGLGCNHNEFLVTSLEILVTGRRTATQHVGVKVQPVGQQSPTLPQTCKIPSVTLPRFHLKGKTSRLRALPIDQSPAADLTSHDRERLSAIVNSAPRCAPNCSRSNGKLFTLLWNPCSRSRGNTVHHRAEYAACCVMAWSAPDLGVGNATIA